MTMENPFITYADAESLHEKIDTYHKSPRK